MSDVATETLYAQETAETQYFKLVRLARQFRGVAITNLDAHIVLFGGLSLKKQSVSAVDPAVKRMVDWSVDVRDKLIGMGVSEKAIVGYLPLQPVPIIDDILVLTARDTKRETIPFPGMRVIPPAGPGAEAADTSAKGKFVIDPFEKSPLKLEAGEESEIEVTVWDDKNNKKKLPGKLKLALKIEDNKIEAVSTDWTVFTQELKGKMFWGSVTRVELAVSIGAELKFQEGKLKNLVDGWTANVKGELAVDLKVPKTSILVNVKGTLSVDTDGKVTPGVGVSIPFDLGDLLTGMTKGMRR